MMATSDNMNRTKENTKREKVLVTLPENYINALDNKIDNILIRTRGDAVISLLTELQTAKPGALKFEEKPKIPNIIIPEWISKRVWFTENIFNQIISLLQITDNANETNAAILLDEFKTNAKIGASVGVEGMKQLRAIRAEKTKVAVEA